MVWSLVRYSPVNHQIENLLSSLESEVGDLKEKITDVNKMYQYTTVLCTRCGIPEHTKNYSRI